jgi:hypothetical protein
VRCEGATGVCARSALPLERERKTSGTTDAPDGAK